MYQHRTHAPQYSVPLHAHILHMKSHRSNVDTGEINMTTLERRVDNPDTGDDGHNWITSDCGRAGSHPTVAGLDPVCDAQALSRIPGPPGSN